MFTRSWVFLGVSASALALFFPVHFARGQCRVNEAAKLTSFDPAAGDRFGTSVSVSGDVAIIGAPSDDVAGDYAGAAYVFRFDPKTGAWAEEQQLTASDAAAVDWFGGSVSVSGDVAVIGADGDDDACPENPSCESGAAYVHRFNGSTWVEEQKLTASDAQERHGFGSAVSISGDVALIGACRDDDAGWDSGSAYIYRFDGSTWVEEQELTASDASVGEGFGWSVSISGNAALIGAPHDGTPGAAYVFRFGGSTWVEEQKLTAFDGAALDLFGVSVSVSGDVALIGAYGDDDGGDFAGAAYVYRFDGGGWVEQQKLTASDATEGAYFGDSVSVSGEVAVIGAYLHNDGGLRSGSAYVYQFEGADWIEAAKLTDSDPRLRAAFGHSVSISGGVAVIGAFSDDDAGENSGAAYLFGAALVPSDPPCGAIDARQPSELDGSDAAGWDSIELVFDEPPGEMNAEEFAVTISPPGDAPTVTDVTVDGNTATVQLSDFIPTEAWTTITHWPTGAVTRIGYLPADVNNDKRSYSSDILFMIDVLNGIVDPPPPLYQTDIDRSGQANPADILRVIDLLNGAGVYEAWNYRSLPE